MRGQVARPAACKGGEERTIARSDEDRHRPALLGCLRVLRSPTVQAVTISDVADELYSLSPADFTTARDQRAREVRAAGQRDVAAAIKKLARPTAGAWLVNQLARRAPDDLARLFEVGQALHEAQRTLAGDRLRELAVQRRQVVADLLPIAAGLAEDAGQPASAAVLGEVRATLEAALADPQAGEAVRSGRLTKSLAYAGLGEVDLSEALALPAERGTGAGQAGKARAQGKDRHEDRDQAAGRLLRESQAAAENAQAALAAAERRVAGLDEQRKFLRRRIDHLRHELDQATAEEAQLASQLQHARRDQTAAASDVRAAERALAKASKRAAGGAR